MANIDINGLPWMEVGDITVGTATTSVSFTGLTISKDDDYLLVSDVYFAVGAGLYGYINGNVTATNYWNQEIYATNATVSGSRNNAPFIAGASTGERTANITKIKLTNSGYFVMQTESMLRSGSATIAIDKLYSCSTFTSTSITQLSIASSNASGIGIGSRFQLYKLVAEKVADITVSTATTTVSISGLNIDKTGEYMLVSDFSVPNNTFDITLFANNNVTNTNYYSQLLTANSTTVSSARYNVPYLGTVNTTFKCFYYINIKLTNSGYFTYQSRGNHNYASTTLQIENFYGASTFTSTSITSLTITAQVASAINIGSRFQLYKLK